MIMKKKPLLTLFLSIFVLAACGGSDNSGNGPFQPSSEGITVSTNTLNVGSAASSRTISVTTQGEWTAFTDDACSAWVKVTTAGTNKTSGTISIQIAANTGYEARTGNIVVKSGTRHLLIPVKQAGMERPVEADSLRGSAGYHLVWHDEFGGTSLSSDWTIDNWVAGRVNNEKQAYPGTESYNGQKLIDVKSGYLSIIARKINNRYYSGRIYGKRNTGWKYGYIAARIRVPAGKGTWPAFWMIPVAGGTWPATGEIDIMEHVGFNPNVVHSTIHCTKYNNGGTPVETANRNIGDATSAFHVYAVEWTPGYMKFYVDNRLLLTYNNECSVSAWPFDKEFYVILNLAWGGDWGGQQGTDDTALPAAMDVDYVRVYQK